MSMFGVIDPVAGDPLRPTATSPQKGEDLGYRAPSGRISKCPGPVSRQFSG
jgi:hypothetical protein